MNRYFYDLHIHSCLSPCGDDDMTPNNIAAMAALKGLNIVALTDHNSCRNCPAFFAACKKNGLIPIAGMELTTSEDIHILCLFEQLDTALRFSDKVNGLRVLIKNRIDIFGRQLILDENDEFVAEEEFLLSNATLLSLDDAVKLARDFGALVIPAHIDRAANGIVATLGAFPPTPKFSCVEFKDKAKQGEYFDKYPELSGKLTEASSDAHYLQDINEPENSFLLDDEPYSSAKVRSELLARLSGLR